MLGVEYIYGRWNQLQSYFSAVEGTWTYTTAPFSCTSSTAQRQRQECSRSVLAEQAKHPRSRAAATCYLQSLYILYDMADLVWRQKLRDETLGTCQSSIK